MLKKDITDFFVDNLLIPKTLLIDKPGIIISKTFSKFGLNENKKRLVYVFEDIFSDLQKNTLNEIGQKKTDKLYFDIGRRIGLRLMAMSNINFHLPEFMIKKLIQNIFKVYSSIGVNREIQLNIDQNKFSIVAKETAICRKTGLVSFYSGIILGILDILYSHELSVDKKRTYCDKNTTNIILKIGEKKKKKVRISQHREEENYKEHNFRHRAKLLTRSYSVQDLIDFKKVRFKKGKHLFMDMVILPFEIGLLGIHWDEYNKNSMENLFNKSIINSSEKLAKKLFKNITEEKYIFVEKMFNSFGFGINYIIKEKKQIKIRCINAPYSKFRPIFYANILNGFINSAENKKYKLEKINFSSQDTRYEIIFEN